MAQISEDGGILNLCHNFEIFSAFVWPEWFLCRGHLSVTTVLDAQVEAFQVGVFPR